MFGAAATLVVVLKDGDHLHIPPNKLIRYTSKSYENSHALAWDSLGRTSRCIAVFQTQHWTRLAPSKCGAVCRLGFKWLRKPTEKAVEASLGVAYKLYKLEKDRKNLAKKYGVWCAHVSAELRGPVPRTRFRLVDIPFRRRRRF